MVALITTTFIDCRQGEICVLNSRLKPSCAVNKTLSALLSNLSITRPPTALDPGYEGLATPKVRLGTRIAIVPLVRGLVQTIFGKISVIVTLGGGGGGGEGGKAMTLRKILLSASIVLIEITLCNVLKDVKGGGGGGGGG